MLECEIWLEIVVLAEIECFAVTIAPIPAVTVAVFVNVTGAEPRGALFMAFRGAQCGEYQVMSGPEFFAMLSIYAYELTDVDSTYPFPPT